MSAKPPRTLRLVLTVVILLAALGWTYSRLARMWQANAELKAAEEALEQDQFDAAREHLRSCLSARPDDADAHFLLGRLERRQENEAEALEEYRLSQKHGGIPEVLDLERLMLRAQKGDLRYAARASDLLPLGTSKSVEGVLLSAGEKAPPERVLILEALARGCMRTFRLRDALGYLDRWLKLKPGQARPLLWRGEVLIGLERETEAIDSYKELVKLWPGHQEGRLALAEALAKAGQPDRALDHFDVVLQAEPASTRALLGRVECLLAPEAHRADAALTDLEKLPAAEAEKPRALVLRGRAEMARTGPESAEDWLRKAVKVDPDNREALASLTLCLTRLNKLTEAQKFQDRVDAIDRTQKQLKETFRQIINAPHNAALHCKAAELYFKVGNDSEGMRCLDNARREDPMNQEMHRILAHYYRDHGKPDLAAQHEAMLSKKP